MQSFRLSPEDEFPHEPDAASNFNESVYCNAFDPKLRMGGWMRLGNRVNEGHAELSVCLYLPDGRIACQFQRPGIASNDRFDAGGLRYEVKTPLQAVSMAYDGELLLLDDPDLLRDPKRLFEEARRAPGAVRFEQRAVSPVHGGEPVSTEVETMYGRDFSLGHFNQHMNATGYIRVGDEEWAIAGNGWRDHSWGPRYWQAIYWYRLLIANFGDDRAFMLLKIADPSGRARRLGVLLVDGEYEEIVDLDILTDWTERHDPRRVRLSVATEKRKALIEGEVLTLAPLRNRRKTEAGALVSRIAEGFTRWTWEGRTGYGMMEYIERIEDGRLVGYPL
jgi:hypothetical protein